LIDSLAALMIICFKGGWVLRAVTGVFTADWDFGSDRASLPGDNGEHKVSAAIGGSRLAVSA
jgi:hypothetical protein